MLKNLNNKIFVKELQLQFNNYISDILGNVNVSFNSISTPESYENNSLIWLNASNFNKYSKEDIEKINATVILTDDTIEMKGFDLQNKCILLSPKSRLLFVKILDNVFPFNPPKGIHSSVIIGDNVKIGKNPSIGPYTIIEDNVKIGDNIYIEGQVYISSNVNIGNNVMIQANTKIGSRALNYSKDLNNELLRFPSLGEVIIDDYVDIGSNVSIVQSGMSKSFIGKYSKINSNSFLGSSVKMGNYNYLSAAVTLCGSVIIGSDNFVGAGSVIRNKVTLGNNNTIGAGAVVVKTIGDNLVLVGNPASNLEKSSGVKI